LNWIAFVSGQDDGLPKAAVTSTGGMTTDSDGSLALKCSSECPKLAHVRILSRACVVGTIAVAGGRHRKAHGREMYIDDRSRLSRRWRHSWRTRKQAYEILRRSRS
jgi:hypothetical protein